MLPAAPDNPFGFFESCFVTGINERILEKFGSNWRDPSGLPINWQEEAVSSEYFQEIVGFLGTLNFSGGTYVLKDPRISRLLGVWLKACEKQDIKPALLIVIRDPVSVARSLWERNHIPSSHSLQLWCRYYIELNAIKRRVPTGVISFEEFIANPEALIHIVSALELNVDQNLLHDCSLEQSLVHHMNAEPETKFEQKLRKIYNRKRKGRLIYDQLLRRNYKILGGDDAAWERRHYGTIAMILDTVLAEKKQQDD